MHCTRVCAVAAVLVLVCSATARAETDTEYGNRGLVSPWSMQGPAEPAKPAARPAAPRPPTFAPAAAAHAKRMTAQQREERRFLKDAAANSRFEAEASRLAMGKSHHAGVRAIASTLINHNASAGNELLHMLHMRGMAAPMLANDQRKVLNRLAKLQGGKFDREFVQEVALRAQQDDVDQYEKFSLGASGDERLKGWVERALPMLRYQLAAAERLALPEAKQARGAAASSQLPPAPRAQAAIRSMGGAPGASPERLREAAAPGSTMQFGGMQFGGDAQRGVTRSVSTKPGSQAPSEANSR